MRGGDQLFFRTTVVCEKELTHDSCRSQSSMLGGSFKKKSSKKSIGAPRTVGSKLGGRGVKGPS